MSYINYFLSFIILATTVYLLLKKDERGWYIIAGEIILGGGGGFFSINSTSLRTLLLICSLIIYTIQIINNKKYKTIFKDSKIICYLFSAILLIVFISSTLGYYAGHNPHQIFADAIPYFFFLYYFPLCELWHSEKFKQTAFAMLGAAIIGNVIFVLLTFISYSSDILVLQDSYYHWFRNIVGGKITDLNNNFYRMVVNEHLLLVPVLLYFIYQIVARQDCHSERSEESLSTNTNYTYVNGQRSLAVARDDKNDKIFYHFIILSLLIIFSLNLTRIYILAYLIGLLFLFSRQYWKRWLIYSLGSIFIFILIFSSIHLAASRGQSFGWELLGLRIGSIASPSIEKSSLSRMMLLPKIWEKIKQKPLWGNGLGDTVTVYSPVVKKEITTTQFDWGYLEIIDEMGMVGFLIWLSFIFNLLFLILKKYRIKNKRYILAMLISLLIINLTSPALFHVLGIILLTAIMTKISYDLKGA